MASLADLERLLERIFERTTARVFRTRVQAVQIERRVERAMERARLADAGRTSVPSRYRVRLHPSDLAAAAGGGTGADQLAGRLADAALAFARAHDYHLSDRPAVSLVADPSLAVNQIEVDAVNDVGRRPAAAAGVQPGTSAPAPAPAPGATGHGANVVAATQAAEPAVPAPVEGTRGVRGDGTGTLIFRRPAPQAARAVLRAVAPDGGERLIEVDGTPLTIGRARDNGVVLADARVSRHHGRLQARRGALVFTDLGSTNGSRVNGVRVDEIVLGEGDRLQIGDTVLLVETLPG